MNFTIDELIHSDTAKKFNISNRPTLTVQYTNLMRLVVEILQPLRNYLKKPVIVTSGFRVPSVNLLVGGVENSQHLSGQAVDIVVEGMTITRLADTVDSLRLPYDQMLLESNGKENWLHISLKDTNNRKERKIYLTQRKEK